MWFFLGAQQLSSVGMAASIKGFWDTLQTNGGSGPFPTDGSDHSGYLSSWEKRTNGRGEPDNAVSAAVTTLCGLYYVISIIAIVQIIVRWLPSLPVQNPLRSASVPRTSFGGAIKCVSFSLRFLSRIFILSHVTTFQISVDSAKNNCHFFSLCL